MSTWGLPRRAKPTLRSRAWFLLLLFFQRKVCPGPAAPCTGAGFEAGVSRAIQHPHVRVRLLPAARRASRWHRGPHVSAGAGGEALHTHGQLREEGEGREGEGPGLYTCPSFVMPTSLCFFDKNLAQDDPHRGVSLDGQPDRFQWPEGRVHFTFRNALGEGAYLDVAI